MALLPILVFGVIGFLILRPMVIEHRNLKHEAFIRNYVFPQGLFSRLQAAHPQLSLKDCQLVAQALRQFFLSHLKSGRKFVSMPSQVVDSLWHEFILYTKDYEKFCAGAFGKFMHHTPAVVLGSQKASDAGLRRCWAYACREEKINPSKPTRLPLLFALDQKLAIANGFLYVADCSTIRRAGDASGSQGIVHCGGDLASASSDGGGGGTENDAQGSHGESGHGADGSDGGGGGDGGGCGGGCGGGGD